MSIPRTGRPPLLLLLLSLPVLPGCVLAVVAAGAAAYGAVSYSDNEAWMDFHADSERVWDAALQSLKENGYAPDPKAKLLPGDTELRAGDCVLKLERHPTGFVRIKVRVGTFDTEDNRRKSGLILENMRQRLAP